MGNHCRKKLWSLAGAVASLCAASPKAYADASAPPEGGLVSVVQYLPLILIALVIWAIYAWSKKRRNAENAQKVQDLTFDLKFQAAAQERQPFLIRVYTGTQAQATASFQMDAIQLGSMGYVPTTQTWVPGNWTPGQYIAALALCLLFFVGVLLLIYMVMVKPKGSLNVTYALQKTASN